MINAIGNRQSAWAYVVVRKGTEVPPSSAYMRAVVDGAREVGLPPEYIATLEAISVAPT